MSLDAAVMPRPRHTHPSAFLFLILPFGVMSGYLTVTVAYQLTHAGIPVAMVASVIALSYVPHSIKFLWSPIADSTFTRRGWYITACVISAIGIALTGMVPARAESIRLLNWVVFGSNFAVTFLAMATESLMAHGTPDDEKGRAGGWFQAGNLGGNGLGGGLGLLIAQHVSQTWVPGVVLGAACLFCCYALRFLPEPPTDHRGAHVFASIWNSIVDLVKVVVSRGGFLALFLCFMPIGSGAASGLWSAVAGEWKASAGTVALVTGVFAGVISAIGCLIGGWMSDRMNRKSSYVLYGMLQAGTAVGMALAPRTQAMYVIWTSIYALVTGFTYAGFSAVVLEAIGHGAAATKYSTYASLSNIPIGYMTKIDGWADTKWQGRGMLFAEAIVGVIGLVLFLCVLGLVNWLGRSAFARRNPWVIAGCGAVVAAGVVWAVRRADWPAVETRVLGLLHLQ